MIARWRRPAPAPLRLRLLAGAGLIAASAILAALIAAWGSVETARLIAEGGAAQSRLELLAQISARVGDYALVAVDGAGARLDPQERAARLAARAAPVREGMAALDRAYAASVAEAEHLGDAVQTARATRGIGLARMRASFEALARAAPDQTGVEGLRATLDSFARLFAPLLNEAIEAERRDSAQARAALDRLRGRMQTLAVVIAGTAVGLLALYYLALIRPLLARLDRVARAAEIVGRGGFDRTPSVDRRDELGLVFAQISRMAARLGRSRRALERDRARLSETVAERTAALTAANARLERADAERRRFFADVGHELRTPLTVILAETDLARRGALAESQLRAALEVIGARARRLNRRIDDLLRVARSEAARSTSRTGPSISPARRGTRSRMRPRLPDASASASRRGLRRRPWRRAIPTGRGR